MHGTSLYDTDLRGIKGITNEELEQQAKSLERVTMPNWLKYEDWLKDREASSLEGTTMSDGQRHTTKFEPAPSYNISDAWHLVTETTEELFLKGPEGGQLIFTSPSRVFDPSSPSEPPKVTAPEKVDEWASWFQRHPNLDTSEPVSVSVGGAFGMRIDVTPSATPENYPRDLYGEQPCVPLYSPPPIASSEGWRDQFVILEVEGEMVLIDVSAPAGKFDEFLPKAEKVLDSVEWKSA